MDADYYHIPIEIYTLSTKPKPGSDYLEFFPGKFRGKYGNEESIYINEDVFDYIESVFYKNLESYSRYENTEITKDNIDKLIQEIEIFSRELTGKTTVDLIIAHLGYDHTRMSDDWKQTYINKKEGILKLCHDMASWLKQAINKTETITIIGI